MAVFVLDKLKKPLMPCSEKRARLLLDRGKAVVHRREPFTVRLKARVGGAQQPLRLKLDPGSKTTGVAVVRETGDEQQVLFLAEIAQRGGQIKKKLQQRANYRRRRRSANLRYRSPRFANRTRPEGWLPPSLQHRVDTTVSWSWRLMCLAPITAIDQELVRFDMQLLQNPAISGVEYQQGTLQGYEIREYVFAKWGRACLYCGAENVPLQLDHLDPKARGGSNRPSNLAPACATCNGHAKKDVPLDVFLQGRPELLARIRAEQKRPLRDAAAVNTTRLALLEALKTLGLPVSTASGGRTKYNRGRLGIPKTHALDAACVGAFERLSGWNAPVLAIACTGRGSYQRTRVDAHGFRRGLIPRQKRFFGFATGDLVRAGVPSGVKAGVHVGRVAVRASGSFNIRTAAGVVQGISHRHCQLLQRADGYGYLHQPGVLAAKFKTPHSSRTLAVA